MSKCEKCSIEVKPGRRFCSFECSEGWMLKRSEEFQRATGGRGQPDTYGSSKKQ